MPLSEHEQRILEEIERRLAEEDPRLVESVSKASVTTHALRRVRLGLVAFALGFVLLLLFIIEPWFAIAGFGVMLASGLVVVHYLRRLGDHAPDPRGGFSVTGALARLAERMRRPKSGPG